ncbi:MAG: MFS transporter [Acidobacteriaceae bacterium]|nr:MFS transporter [Acidobacteriaceae bacterium]MBV9780325.1 MFS transporter [Acidobacteriaceae bacterium]
MISEQRSGAHLGAKRSRGRWWVVWTLFCSTAINYINRQTLSVLAPVITREFHLSHSQLSSIFGAFQIAYAGMWLVGGIFLDVVGTRLGLSIAVVWWSLVSMATSLVNSPASLSVLRFFLGIGEGVNWPGASKAVAEFFPAEERSVAVAIFDSGSSVGGAVAALSVPWIALEFGWRAAFIFSGLLGFIWLALWLNVYRSSTRPMHAAHDERLTLRNALPILKERETWAIVIGRSLTDPIWWFYVFWLPQYLSDTRGFSLKQIAIFAWIPFVAADLGNFAGGLASGALVKRGIPVMRARKWVCVISCIPLLAGIPAALISNPFASLGFICFALFGFASWSTMGLTFPSDLFPPRVVATVTGLSGLAAGLAGTLFTLLVGTLVDRFSYLPAFVLAATAPILATVSVIVLIRRPAVQAGLAA